MSILSENIKAIRLSQDESGQTEFGEKIGVGQSTIVRWEKGSDPKPDNLLALARLAGISIEQLITTPIAAIPKREKGEALPSGTAFESLVAEALQEVPPGTPLSGYPRIVGSSLRDRLELLLKHGASPGTSGEASAPGKAAPPPATTKGRGKAEPRNP